ncbi:Abscisic acid-insensitive [Thalictrum thalictroides]|uniref:Abscisic acid-insensitive n=1 Tax=Thalictrum thalictroides TaxID=46969 RepID=A0A7J6VJL6_THATH|nr:Abscisic acid-insensitive [Thalictrum thalictroides]
MGTEAKTTNHKELEQGSAPPLPPTQGEDHPKTTNPLSFLGRQSSIYSLTLDEFQNTICCENGKTFGSMNMDEFLTNIWTAEEHQAAIKDDESITSNQNDSTENNKSPMPQSGLHRQGSLTLPAPLSQKTVEEVWSEIHREQQQQQQQQHHPGNTSRQQTFGEMTLEDFLVKAGVVRESIGPSSSHHHGPPPPAAPPPPSQQYGLYQSNNTIADPNFGMGPVMSLGNFSDHRNTPNSASGGMSAYQSYPQGGTVLGELSSYAGNGKRNGGYPPGMCFSGRVGNGAGFTPTTIGNGSPASPVSSDGMCTNPVDNTNSVAQYGMDMGGARGRKRIIDGPVEKVVERRQRRMIKNRESAARSRARKQAYTVELEAELNQLKEENARLKQAVAEIVKKRRQELQEEIKERPPTKAQRAAEKLKMLRRTISSI